MSKFSTFPSHLLIRYSFNVYWPRPKVRILSLRPKKSERCFSKVFYDSLCSSLNRILDLYLSIGFSCPWLKTLTMALITLIVKTFDRDDQTDSKIHQPCAYLQKWRHTQCALLFRVLWDTCGDFVYISNKFFFCLKNKLKIPNRPHTSNNCSELRKSYKQHGYLDKNNSRHTVNFFPFSRHTVNFLDVSRHTLNPIETLWGGENSRRCFEFEGKRVGELQIL